MCRNWEFETYNKNTTFFIKRVLNVVYFPNVFGYEKIVELCSKLGAARQHLFVFSSRLEAHEHTKHNYYNISTKTKKKRLKQTTTPTFKKTGDLKKHIRRLEISIASCFFWIFFLTVITWNTALGRFGRRSASFVFRTATLSASGSTAVNRLRFGIQAWMNGNSMVPCPHPIAKQDFTHSDCSLVRMSAREGSITARSSTWLYHESMILLNEKDDVIFDVVILLLFYFLCLIFNAEYELSKPPLHCNETQAYMKVGLYGAWGAESSKLTSYNRRPVNHDTHCCIAVLIRTIVTRSHSQSVGLWMWMWMHIWIYSLKPRGNKIRYLFNILVG